MIKYGIPRSRVPVAVVFQRRITRRRWWHLFTGDTWAHCWMVVACPFPEPGLMADYYTLKVDPLPSRLHVDLVWAAPIDVLAALLERDEVTDVVELTLDIGVNEIHCPRASLTCVSVAKAIMGVWWPLIITPRQLHRKLLALGASSVRGYG